MRFAKLSGMVMGILLFSIPAFAGAISGGGGKAVVCRNPAGKIISAEMLDLFEGRVQYGYKIQSSTASYISQYQAVLKNISKGRSGMVDYSSQGDFVNSLMSLLPDGTGLVPIDDSYEVIIPKNCKVEQFANFNDNQQSLLVDGEIWASMSETNKAALISHEAIYWVLRMLGDTNSIRSRQAVALGFSGVKFNDYQSGLPLKPVECYSDNSNGDPLRAKFWIYNDTRGNLILQFDWISLRPSLGQVMSKTTVNLGKIKIDDAVNSSSPVWVGTDSILPTQTISVKFVPSEDPSGDLNIYGDIGLGAYPNPPMTKFTCVRN